MPGSGDARATATATEWRTESRYYRRSPGWGWLLGLLLIPLLFGWLGWSALKPHVSVSVPSMSVTAPTVAAPALNFAPLSIVRNGQDFTVTGELPDMSVKDKLLGSLKAALGPGVNLIDKLTVKGGVSAPAVDGIGQVFKAAGDINDFSVNLTAETLTLAGTAPSEDVKAAVESAAKSVWPNVNVINNIQVKGAPAATGDCGSLQAGITSALSAPIAYQTDGFTLTAATKTELTAVAAAIKACPDAKVTVTGHTDNTGNDAVNIPLSNNRAKSVADYLVSQGVPAGSISAKGVGSSQPVGSNNTPEGRAQNRRTDITVN